MKRVAERPPVSRERAAAVGLVLAAAVSRQIGAAFAVTLFDELVRRVRRSCGSRSRRSCCARSGAPGWPATCD